jgi:hypothetical protein
MVSLLNSSFFLPWPGLVELQTPLLGFGLFSVPLSELSGTWGGGCRKLPKDEPCIAVVAKISGELEIIEREARPEPEGIVGEIMGLSVM